MQYFTQPIKVIGNNCSDYNKVSDKWKSTDVGQEITEERERNEVDE